MIDRNEHVRCSWCYGVSPLGDWTDLTYSQCTNREMKRAFTPLMQEKAFMRKSDTYYMCPKCGKWSRGSQLRIVDTEDQRLLKLGGDTVFTELGRK